MSKLAQLLSYLESPGVTELVFRSGAAAVMHSGTHVHPVTVTPLQRPQILRLFEGTPVITHLPKGPGVQSQTVPMDLLGTRYEVTLSGSDAPLEIRVGKARAPRAIATTWTDIPGAEIPDGMGRRPRRPNPTPTPTRADPPTARDLPTMREHDDGHETPSRDDDPATQR